MCKNTTIVPLTESETRNLVALLFKVTGTEGIRLS